MKLIVRFSIIARANGHATPQDSFNGWTGIPLIIHPVQTNGFDCGVWTLAGIWAVLGGFEVTSHTEATIGRVRSCLLSAILALPESQYNTQI